MKKKKNQLILFNRGFGLCIFDLALYCAQIFSTTKNHRNLLSREQSKNLYQFGRKCTRLIKNYVLEELNYCSRGISFPLLPVRLQGNFAHQKDFNVINLDWRFVLLFAIPFLCSIQASIVEKIVYILAIVVELGKLIQQLCKRVHNSLV